LQRDRGGVGKRTLKLNRDAASKNQKDRGVGRLDMLARRRARIGCCPKCNYDRAGLAPGSVCPECGAAMVAA